MKRKVFFLFSGFFLLIGLCSCHKISGNHPYVDYLNMQQEGEYYFMENYLVSLEQHTYRPLPSDERIEYTLNEAVYYGGTAPRYGLDCIPEGYEGIKEHLNSIELTSSAVIEVYGVARNGSLSGYINVYKDTIGYLSGGGNYGVEEIDYSYRFSYEPSTDSFAEYTKIEGAMMVAVHDSIVMYWKNRAYYLYDEATEEERLLVEDKAYDTGLQHQSRTSILTNEEFTLIEMVKAKGVTDTYYLYLYVYETNEWIELSLEE